MARGASAPVSPYRRIVVTGANGSGKTHLSRQLAAAADYPLIHFDAIKLTTGWQVRPRAEIRSRLRDALTGPTWICEGGPSMLATALPKADVVIWLDRHAWIRAWYLARRALRYRGRTRPELPPGNPQTFGSQLRFGWKSIQAQTAFRDSVGQALAATPDIPQFHCRTQRDIDACARTVCAHMIH